jgi:transcriptional regulator with XRE-family HTH domain
LIHNKKFGQAIAVIRQRYSLRQTDIPDLTDRQLRRIESGEARPSVSTLKLIAKAHKLKLEVYLDEVSKVLTTGK